MKQFFYNFSTNGNVPKKEIIFNSKKFFQLEFINAFDGNKRGNGRGSALIDNGECQSNRVLTRLTI